MRGRVHRSTAPDITSARAAYQLPQLPKPAVDGLFLLAVLVVFCALTIGCIFLLVWLM